MFIFSELVETPRGLITLGTNMFGGLEQKGVKNLQDCIKVQHIYLLLKLNCHNWFDIVLMFI